MLKSIPHPLFYWRPSANRHGFSINFGDALFPLICQKIIGKPLKPVGRFYPFPKLLAGGSILHFAGWGDCLWGVGLRDSNLTTLPRFVDIRAVRGPITRAFIKKKKISCPDIFGDPALLIPKLFPEWIKRPQLGRIGFVPHYRSQDQFHNLPPHIKMIRPTQSPEKVIQNILQCNLVISGSLHGIIVAEAFGIPARWLPDQNGEPTLKFNDYYESTNRIAVPARSLSDAENRGGQSGIVDFNLDALLASFPRDIHFKFSNNLTEYS